MTIYLYADVIILTALLVTVPMLWGVARAYGLKFKVWRACAASSFCGAVTLVTVLLKMNYLQMSICACAAFLIILLIVFGRLQIGIMLRAFMMLLGEMILLGGFAAAINNIFSDSARGFISIGCVIAGVILLIISLRLRKSAHSVSLAATMTQNCKISIMLNDKYIELNAMLDSGNTLVEPLSQCPVMLIKYEIANCVFHNELLTPDSDLYKSRVRYVPYIGANTQDILACVRADSVKTEINGVKKDLGDVYIGVSATIRCDALVGSAFLNIDE